MKTKRIEWVKWIGFGAIPVVWLVSFLCVVDCYLKGFSMFFWVPFFIVYAAMLTMSIIRSIKRTTVDEVVG